MTSRHRVVQATLVVAAHIRAVGTHVDEVIAMALVAHVRVASLRLQGTVVRPVPVPVALHTDVVARWPMS